MSKLTCTVITANTRATKKFWIENNVLKSEGGCNLFKGNLEIKEFLTFEELQGFLNQLKTNQAVIWGVPKNHATHLTTKGNETSLSIARTKDNFQFSNVMMFDYDCKVDPLKPLEYLQALNELLPDLGESNCLLRPSCTSYIYKGEEELKGPGGLRLLLEVTGDIERAARILTKRSLLLGKSQAMVTKDGRILIKPTLFDPCVFQSNRIDYAASPELAEPLQRRIPEGRGGFSNDKGTAYDLNTLKDLTTAEERMVLDETSRLKESQQSKAKKVKRAYVDVLVDSLLDHKKKGPGKSSITDEAQERLKLVRTVKKALEVNNSRLEGDFLITLARHDNNGTHDRVTAREIFQNREKYHLMTCFDPLEPEYGDWRITGVIYSNQEKPLIHSFAHGSQTYYLTEEVETVNVTSWTSEQYIEWLNDNGYNLRRNVLNGYIYNKDVYFNDVKLNSLKSDFLDFKVQNPRTRANWEHIEAIIQGDKYLPGFNPIEEVLKSLPTHDGIDHIEAVAKALGINRRHLEVFLGGCIRKIKENEPNVMLVLHGVQQAGKSYFCNWLARPFIEKSDSLFREAPIKPEDKDDLRRATETFLWEVTELESTTRKADVNALKGFLTTKNHIFRRAYDRLDTNQKSTCNFIGTVNSKDFLVDETGNRRFLVCECQETIDFSYSKTVQIEQLWSQAIEAWKEGKGFLTREEQALVNEANKAYLGVSATHEVLDQLLIVTNDDGDFVRTSTILELLKDRGINLGVHITREIGGYMKRNGLKAVNRRTTMNTDTNQRCRGYLGIVQASLYDSQKRDSDSQSKDTNLRIIPR